MIDTSMAAFRMKRFASSSQIAGTVNTQHMSSLISVSNPYLSNRCNKWSLKYLIAQAKTVTAGNSRPRMSDTFESLVSFCLKKKGIWATLLFWFSVYWCLFEVFSSRPYEKLWKSFHLHFTVKQSTCIIYFVLECYLSLILNDSIIIFVAF